MPPAGPLIAHRGASALCPENTLAAIDRARADGCGWVEVDAQVLSDGAVILMHDHDLDRTTDGFGPVGMQDLSYIRALRTRDPATAAPTDHRVPRLAEVLDYCAAQSLGLVLEIKATWGVDAEDAASVAALLPDEPAFPLIVTSFSVTALATVASLRPDIALGLAVLRPPVDPAAARDRLTLSAVHCNAQWTTADDIACMKAAGLDVAIATINDPKLARDFLAMGADGIMTDHPTLLAGSDA
jgi:glycerophosphoryl diester phosphodiesterase